MLKEAIQKAKENPNSPFAIELRQRIESGKMNDIAMQEGLDFSQFITKESVQSQAPEQKKNFLQKTASFLGVEKFGKGIGQAMSNISGVPKQLLKTYEEGLALTNDLQTKITENKRQGLDTSRLEQALNRQNMSNKTLAVQMEDLTTGGLTGRDVAGSALSTAALFVPGAAKSAGLATKMATGAGIGYAIDVGSKLQNNELTYGEAFTPGTATFIGAALPVAGTILGKTFKGVSKGLEKQNLRLTPNEKRLLGGKVDDVVAFNQKNKLVGSPGNRFSKVSSIVDDFERQVTKKVDSFKGTFGKEQIKTQITNIKSKFADDLADAPTVSAKIDSILKQIDKVAGDSISATRLNTWKRNLWKAAYSKGNDQIVNDALYEVGESFMDILNKSIDGLKPLNKDYGIALTSKRLLHKATSRPQVGLLGHIGERLVGGGIGTMVGGPAGGFIGAAVTPNLASGLATPTRSALSVGLKGIENLISKIPTDKAGNLLITQKALNLLIKDSLEKAKGN